MQTSTRIFAIFAIIWEVAVGLLFGFFIRYSPPSTFNTMSSFVFYYNWSLDPQTSQLVTINNTQIPYPFIVVLLFVALLVVGTS